MRSFRFALLVGVLAAVAANPARANECCAPAPSCCTVTCYRTEYRTETYTSYRCESYPVQQERVCTYYEHVPCTEWVTHKTCVCVPYCEERTCYQNFVTCKPVTKMVRKCVDRGHWECREVPCCNNGCGSCCNSGCGSCCGLKSKLRGLFHHGCGCNSCCNDCCNSCCNDCCQSCCTRTEKVWCPCPTWEECAVTCYERCCECRPVTHKVTCYRHEWREEKCAVTTCKCVAKQRCEKYTVWCTRKVAVPCTRCVPVCVPYQVQVPSCNNGCNSCGDNGCNSCCQSSCHSCCFKTCCNTCSSCCNSCGHSCGGFFKGCFNLGHHGCCN